MKFLFFGLIISLICLSNLIVLAKNEAEKGSKTKTKSEPQTQLEVEDQIQLEAEDQTQSLLEDDCYILFELFKTWNNPKKVNWDITREGGCCDGKNIVCNNYLGKKRIVELNLKNYTFSGDITEKITQLEYLNNLSLAENQFTTFPQNLDKLIYLTKLSVRHNNITGNIPNNIGNIDGIFHLDLSENNFDGPIPESFSKLKQLQFLNLSKNNLQGYIPESFNGFKKLTTLDIAVNQNLKGYVPLLDTITNCTYQETGLCYREGTSCISEAKLCTDEEIKDTKLNNGFDSYLNETNINVTNSTTCDCNTEKGVFDKSLMWMLIVVGVIVIVALIACSIINCRKREHTKMRSSRLYSGYYY